MIHTYMPRNCTVFLKQHELTRKSNLWTHIFDSTKWPTILFRKVKGKPYNFETQLCGSLYSTYKTSLYNFITNGCKHFSQTSLPDRRQRIPLTLLASLLHVQWLHTQQLFSKHESPIHRHRMSFFFSFLERDVTVGGSDRSLQTINYTPQEIQPGE